MWHHFFLVCVLFSSTIGQQSYLNYMLLIPAQMEYPSNETLCLEVIGAKETVNIAVTLHHGPQDTSLLQQKMTTPKLFKCVEFQCPCPNGGKEEVISIHISIVGPNTQLSESKNILVRNMGSFTLIQTDRPLYRKGETVKIRILNFNKDLMATNEISSLVEIQDPKNNRIGQWSNLKPVSGIIDLSFPLDSESQLGAYKIIAPNAQQDFHVSEYEPPKFEVVVQLPPVVTIKQVAFPLRVCGRFTHGKPVQGNIKAKLCRPSFCYSWMKMKNECPQDICTMHTKKSDKNGCMETVVPTESYHLNSYNYLMKFDVEASIVEDGTGLQSNGSASCRVSAMTSKVTFGETEASNSYYKFGLKYKTKVKLQDAAGSPMKSQTLYITEKYDKVVKEHVYQTDEKGEACFSLDTRSWNGHTVYLTAVFQKKNPERVFGVLNPYSADAHRALTPFSSATNSFIKVQPLDNALRCDHENSIEIDYLIRSSELITEEDTIDLRFVFVARGNLVSSGWKKINIERNSVMMGTMEVLFPVTANLAPIAHMFAYVLLGNGKIAADTEVFNVEKCFNNKVTLAFASKEVFPNSQTTLRVNAQPGSLCSVRSVDESVLFLKPESDINIDAVYSRLEQRRRYGYPYRVREDNPICLPITYSHGAYHRKKRSFNWSDSAQSTGPDVFTLLENIAIKFLTNTVVRKRIKCPHYPIVAALSLFGEPQIESFSSNFPVFIYEEESDAPPIHPSISTSEVIKRIRKKFSETLLWEMVRVGASGQADIDVHVPDSITEWKATAFCMGDDGLGIANTTSLRAFKPMFISMTHPYSVVRGEKFLVNASIYNYLPKPIMVKVSLQEPAELKVDECPTCVTDQCLYPEQNLVLTWKAQALIVGSAEIVVSVQAIDTKEECGGEKTIVPEMHAYDGIMKTVIIKAEGMPVEKSHNSILCGEDNLSSETIFIEVPSGAVPNSATAVFSVVGDLMGSALQGSEQLLTLPKGCGEQSMVTFVPNIYVMNYLEYTNQLTEDIKKQGVKYITHGYQRQLDFCREDGSFSAFGKNDEDGNTWLTAFVMKGFHAASRHISVDKKYIEDTGKWLKDNQLPSGCFRNRGKLFKNTLKGGVNDLTSLCAYVTTAFLETGWPVKDPPVQNALECLRNSIHLVDSVYTKSLLAYTFTLAKDYDMRERLLQELHDKAVKKEGVTYWPANLDILQERSTWSEPNSNEVEMASYVMLAHLSLETLTMKDIIEASCIAKGIAQQRNPHGGFANTQDTVTGFQALALFYKTTYTKCGVLEVTLSMDTDDILYRCQVDEKTRFLLQRKQLPKLPGKYTVKVKGEGCVFIQTSLKYNIHTATARPAFDMETNVAMVKREDQATPVLKYNISVRYTGPRNASNMALVQVELPSGFSANEASLTEMTKGLVKKAETEESCVNIYILELKRTFLNIIFLAEQKVKVENQKSKMIKVMDYYNSGEEAITTYDVPSY